MYEKIDITKYFDSASDFLIKNDRSLYFPYLKYIEEYCFRNEMIIGDYNAVNRVEDKDSYFFDIYSDDIFNKTKDMVDELYNNVKSKFIDNKYIQLQTFLPNKELIVYINARQICRVYFIGRYKGVSINQYIKPIIDKGIFAEKSYYMPEIILLIQIYRSLYNPSKLNEWGKYVELENKLYKFTDGNAKLPGRERVSNKDDMAVAKKIFKMLKEYILIGDYAINLHKSLPLAYKPDCKLQIIAPDNEVFIKSMKSVDKKITHIEYQLFIPNDIQIKKTIFYLDKKPLFEVFNSTSFELIPYDTISGVKVGSAYVLLRFKYINLLTLSIIENAREDKLLQTRQDIEFIRNLNVDFFPSTYDGVYINDAVIKKKLSKDQVKHYPYFPYLNETN